MQQWWIRNHDVDLGGLKKGYIEDFTGGIPLLLEQCVVENPIEPSKKMIDLGKICETGDKALSFTNDIWEATGGVGERWKLYVHLIQFLGWN
jgi:hypothetical protein